MRQQNKFLGHVIRSDTLDPMRLPTIDRNLNTPGLVLRRTGKPRLHWAKENCKFVYKHVLEKEWPIEPELEALCIQEIVNVAMEDRF